MQGRGDAFLSESLWKLTKWSEQTEFRYQTRLRESRQCSVTLPALTTVFYILQRIFM